MSKAELTIQPMNGKDLAYALALAEKDGWSAGMDDGRPYQRVDPEGFLLGTLDGVSVGCISAIAFDERFGSLGLHVVAPAFRGNGYEQQLWAAGLARLGTERTVALDVVVARQERYHLDGFAPACRMVRYQCPGGLRLANEEGLVELAQVPAERIADYDRQVFPADRTALLAASLETPGAKGYAVVAGDVLCGYGIARRCRGGYRVGPLCADNGGVAERLYCKLSSLVDIDDWVFLDVPDQNADAVLLAERFTMREVARYTRLYRGEVPPLRNGNIFGISSLGMG